MTRLARARSSFLGLCLVLLALPIWLAARSTSGTGVENAHTVTATPPDFRATLIRAGLSPDALAAAGVPAGGVRGVLQAAADAINADVSRLPGADAALAQTRKDVDQLRRKVQSGLATKEEVAALRGAETSQGTATARRQAALNDFFAAATAGLPAAQRDALARIRANRAQEFLGEFPVAFLVVERSEKEWVALRDALANERIATKLPDTLDSGAQARLAAWRSAAPVSAATAALNASSAAVEASWSAAAGAPAGR